MADVSKIKLPNGTTYNIKDTTSGYTTNTGTITKIQTTAGAHTTINVSSGAAAFNVPTKTSHLTNDSGFITNAGVTYIKGNAESTYRTGQVNLTAANIGAVGKNDELLTTSPFAPASLKGPYISKIDNGFYAADKRWNVTLTNASGSVSQLFDGSYESNVQIKNGDTAILTLDFSNESSGYFPGYPYGYILLSFYYVTGPASISGRVYCNYQSQGIGWHDLVFTRPSDSTDGAQVYIAQQNYYAISKIEITIVGDTSNSYGWTGLTQVEMHLTRPDPSKNPFLSKYSAETLYYDLTAPNFIGNLTGNVTGNVSGTAANVTGTVAIANGGTGQTTAANAINALLNGLPVWTADPTDTTYFVRQDTGGSATYGKVAFSTIWNYISGKLPAWSKASTKPSYNFSEIGSTPTTLSGYGITDAKIASGVITLGSNTITPLTSSSTLSASKLSGAIPSAVTATTQASTDNSTKIATTAYVTTAIANLPEPMVFKGSVGTGGTITSLPTAAASNEGHTYKVITTLSSPAAKVGDTVISNGSSWVVIPSGDEPSGTVTSVGVSNATNGGLTVSGSPVTSSGTITIGHSNVLSSAQTTQAVYPIKIDKNGHISAYGSAVTIPTVPSNIVNTITTTAGAHTAISSATGTVSFNVPTTAAHVGAATSDHTHGNITSGGDITATAPTIASGDQLIINDDSASKVTNGPTFDGSTTTKALSQKGTWETFSNSLLYGECTTSGSTAAKEVTVDSSFKLVTGATVAVKFSGGNTAGSPTLNVNSTGAKGIVTSGTTSAGTNGYTAWTAGETVPLIYNGTNWVIMNNMSQNNLVIQSHSTSTTNYDMALSNYTSNSGGAAQLYHSNKIKGNPSTGRVTTEDLSDSDIDALINDLDVTGTYGSVEVKKLLWTNPSPTSAFAAQKINLNLADYDVVEIHAYAALGTNYSQIVSSSADIGTTGTFIGIKPVEKASTDTTTIMQRSFEVADDGVTFTGGIYRLYSATTIGTAPDVYIPYKIYGIKNNFNVGSISVVDNVVEQGTSGNWTYRKWNSGIGECWLQYNPGSYTCGTARGSLYSGGNLSLTYPITFVSYPTVTGNVSLGTDAYVVWLQFTSLGTSAAQCRIVSSGSVAANSNYLISVYVTGRWK